MGINRIAEVDKCHSQFGLVERGYLLSVLFAMLQKVWNYLERIRLAVITRIVASVSLLSGGLINWNFGQRNVLRNAQPVTSMNCSPTTQKIEMDSILKIAKPVSWQNGLRNEREKQMLLELRMIQPINVQPRPPRRVTFDESSVHVKDLVHVPNEPV
jgi:hypothetical protein